LEISQKLIDKIINDENVLNLELVNENKKNIGFLKPVTKGSLNPEIINAITEWRKKNTTKFLTQFNATFERTKNWIENVILKTPGQMLFLIYSDAELIGHVGFKNLTEEDIMLDNMMLGKRSKYPRMSTIAEKRLIDWIFSTIKIKKIYGLILTDNVTSIMMHKNLGFKGWDKYPLIKYGMADDIKWELGRKNELSGYDKYCYKISIDYNDYN
tara:strand:- start:25452 stop:26090 length:639 start_codon:yes stop_codon:yes gene_type:complete